MDVADAAGSAASGADAAGSAAPGAGAIGTTPVRQPIGRVDQRNNAFYRRKYAPGSSLPGGTGQPPAPAGSEPADALQRVFFGERRRANCLNETFAGAVDGPVRPVTHRFASPDAAARHIESAARFFGADMVGIAVLENSFIYTHAGHESGAAAVRAGTPVELSHRYAVVVAVEMDYRLIASSPSFIDAAEVGRGYLRAGFTAVTLAAYIRELGWPARAHTVRDEQVLHVPLAVLAGLGELGRNGFLVTAKYGPRVRLATVTTDLPLTPAGPVDIGVSRFCQACLKCARCCPSQSIPAGEREWVGGVLKWPVDGDSCLAFWESAPDRWCNCNNCIKVCPWNKPDTWWHRAAAGAARRWPALAGPLVWLDDRLYGRNPRPHVTFLDYDNHRPIERK